MGFGKAVLMKKCFRQLFEKLDLFMPSLLTDLPSLFSFIGCRVAPLPPTLPFTFPISSIRCSVMQRGGYCFHFFFQRLQLLHRENAPFLARALAH